MSQYILNLETNKIELHFTKEAYKELPEADKKELKRFFLFSSSRKAWVSRSTNNHYSAVRTAEKLGFTKGGETGERLSFSEKIEREASKAEARAERMEYRAEKAVKRAEQMQAEWKEKSNDWSYVTQPIIKGHSGAERFAKQRQRVLDRYGKGFEEYRKSEYFLERAETARRSASMEKFKSKSYLNNRIEESNKEMRRLESLMIQAEEKGDEERISKIYDTMEYELDKLAHLHNLLEAIGGITYNKDNIKPGYYVLVGRTWDKVVKANNKTVEVQSSVVSYTMKYPYAEIEDVKIPDDWKEEKKTAVNPFEIDDIVIQTSIGGERIIKAFQVVRKTDKNVIIQQIKIEDNQPVKDAFVNDKQERRAVKQDRNKNYVINFESWYLYKYNQTA